MVCRSFSPHLDRKSFRDTAQEVHRQENSSQGFGILKTGLFPARRQATTGDRRTVGHDFEIWTDYTFLPAPWRFTGCHL